VPAPGEGLSLQLPTGTFERPKPRPAETSPSVPSAEDRQGAEATAGGVMPDLVVRTQAEAVPPSTSPEQTRINRPRQVYQGGKDIVISTAIQELRTRIE
jgi:hypothetical protein